MFMMFRSVVIIDNCGGGGGSGGGSSGGGGGVKHMNTRSWLIFQISRRLLLLIQSKF